MLTKQKHDKNITSFLKPPKISPKSTQNSSKTYHALGVLSFLTISYPRKLSTHPKKPPKLTQTNKQTKQTKKNEAKNKQETRQHKQKTNKKKTDHPTPKRSPQRAPLAVAQAIAIHGRVPELQSLTRRGPFSKGHRTFLGRSWGGFPWVILEYPRSIFDGFSSGFQRV